MRIAFRNNLFSKSTVGEDFINQVKNFKFLNTMWSRLKVKKEKTKKPTVF